MQKWEYVHVSTETRIVIKGTTGVEGGKRGLADVLNDLGELGWEAVGIASTPLGAQLILLKRQKQ